MYEPKRPTLAAVGFLVVFVAVLALPLLQGQWLAGSWSDQYAGGYAVRSWAAEQWRATGAVPQWNPMIFGGLPYVATTGHGDVFYPTSFLRLVLPADVVLSLSFVLHTMLAGVFTYLFLRRLGITWLGAVVGGVAYQLSGIIISLPNPGHDGKLFVSTLLPLAFLAVHVGVRERRAWGYALLGLVVGCSLLSPHVQMTYYLLVASGLFALYCAVGEPDPQPASQRLIQLALALAAVAVGFGIAAPQLLPFMEYLPHSPRAEGMRGFAESASYAIPWDHVPEFLIGGFSGETERYWGTNPLKLHSEYLGLPALALAVLGAGDRRRRLVWWLGGIGLLFLLISLGGSTPFYRVWWTVMPLVKKTRAPGMAFFVVAFLTAVLAALGTARLERGEGKAHVKAWLAVAGAVALLALTGAFGSMAVALAPPEKISAARALAGAIRLSGLVSGLALAIVALLSLGRLGGRVPAVAFTLALPIVLGADLWRDGRQFWDFQPPARAGLYREDPLVTRVRETPPPFRVLDLSAVMGASAYPLNVLQGHDVPQVLGYFGFELRYYDELLGGKNEWRYLLGSTRLWDLLGVRFVVTPDTLAIPGYHHVLGPVETGAGGRAHLYEADTAPSYARVVPAAAKADAEAIPPTLADPRLPGFDRVVLVPQDAPITAAPLTAWPPPSPARARVTAWRAGAMTIELDPVPPADSYLLVSENWYVDWRATVDGASGQVLRGDHSLITVPVPAGARRVELTYRSATYARGKAVSLVALLAVAAGFIVPPVRARRRRA
ncbi:MAG TPA: YfhO family protein [Gemmatimonadales bacterium]|nr:YfhO family protein [Gemmatimonadales bacterium]